MKRTDLAIAVALACVACTGYAAADQVIGTSTRVPTLATPVSQPEMAASPSDVAAPTAVQMQLKDDAKDEWQKDGGDVKGGGKGGCAEVEPCELCPADSNCLGVKIGGWTQIGYHDKESYWDLFNQNPGRVNLHQQWLYAERIADGERGWDWGFRFDAMYGIDADNTQSFGNNPDVWDEGWDHGQYGFALPQAYVELARNDLQIKIGHFYTLIGYEVVPAPMNFFYSHAFTMNNSEPFTHTGVLANWAATDRLTLSGGWTAGWDTGFDRFNDGSNFIGGFAYSLTDNVTMTYMNTVGNFGWIGEEAYEHSLIFNVSLTDRLTYVFENDVLGVGSTSFDTVGINQYLIYALNDCWGFGVRAEWWRADFDTNDDDELDDTHDYGVLTFGVNYKPHTNLVFRPEVSHEWSPDADLAQTIFGIDAVLTY